MMPRHAAVLVLTLPTPARTRRRSRPGRGSVGERVSRTLRKGPHGRFAHGQALHEAVRRIELSTEDMSIAIYPTIVAPPALTPQGQRVFSLAVRSESGPQSSVIWMSNFFISR